MVRQHHQLNGHEFEQTPGEREGQGNLACCSPWGCKVSDTTQRLKNNNNNSDNDSHDLLHSCHVLGKNMNDFSYSQLDHTTTLEDSRLLPCKDKDQSQTVTVQPAAYSAILISYSNSLCCFYICIVDMRSELTYKVVMCIKLGT